MIFPFGEYRPDVSDFRAATTRALANVLPRGDGYGPFPDLTALTAALAASCRGLFFARKADGTVVMNFLAYRVTFNFLKFGYGAAIANVIFLTSLVLAILYVRLVKPGARP